MRWGEVIGKKERDKLKQNRNKLKQKRENKIKVEKYL